MSSNSDLDNFVGLSAILTGFAASDINPPLSPQPVAVEYLKMLQSKVDASLVTQLLNTYQSIAQLPPEEQPAQVQARILIDQKMGPVARNIIRMWYLSIWYDGYESDQVSGFSPGTVVSSNAYTKGLAWDAMQAHPMGYSEMHYGYWTDPPEPDNSTGGGSQEGSAA
jgi:hypothetical protein